MITNTCDKCGYEDSTYTLIWITADDFTPRKNEKLKVKTYKKYDALCLSCYKSELL